MSMMLRDLRGVRAGSEGVREDWLLISGASMATGLKRWNYIYDIMCGHHK